MMCGTAPKRLRRGSPTRPKTELVMAATLLSSFFCSPRIVLLSFDLAAVAVAVGSSLTRRGVARGAVVVGSSSSKTKNNNLTLVGLDGGREKV